MQMIINMIEKRLSEDADTIRLQKWEIEELKKKLDKATAEKERQ